MFVVYYEKGNTRGYIKKHDGMCSFLGNPSEASHYLTRDDAWWSGRAGHHPDMGGDGIRGTIVPLDGAVRNYRAMRGRFGG